MANRNFTNFRAVYDDLTDEIERTRSQFFRDHLENWFSLIDETPGVREIVKSLESPLFGFFLNWLPEIKGTSIRQRYEYPSPPPPKMVWPQGRDKRLGTQLLVFREIVKGNETASEFGRRFILGVNPETAERELIEHVFLPMARDLRRKLEAELADKDDLPIPASDRVVRRDDNAANFQEAVDALDSLEHALQVANEYEDLEDKEQRIAEVSAGRRLLEATRVRVEALKTVVEQTVKYLAKKFADVGIGKAAAVAWEAIAKLIGF